MSQNRKNTHSFVFKKKTKGCEAQNKNCSKLLKKHRICTQEEEKLHARICKISVKELSKFLF